MLTDTYKTIARTMGTVMGKYHNIIEVNQLLGFGPGAARTRLFNLNINIYAQNGTLPPNRSFPNPQAARKPFVTLPALVKDRRCQ